MSEKISTKGKQAKFVIMPMEIFLNPHVNGRSKNLFSFLYMYKNSEYGCYASNHYLARMCVMPERRVTECLNILEKWKYIRIENRKSGERRRIFISNFEEVYSKASKLCFDMRKDSSDFDADFYKNLFFNAREGKI